MATARQKSGAGPGKGRRRQPSRGDLKEEAILGSAVRLLASKPLAEITVEELAAGAGISRPGFYFYFDSRDAVIHALSERLQAELFNVGIEALNGIGEDPEATIRTLAEGYMQLWVLNGPLLRALATLESSDSQHRAFWGDIVDGTKQVLVGAIEAERAAGRALPAPPDASDLAGIWIGMWWRAGYDLSFAPRPEETIGRVVDTLTEVSYRAIYGRPTESRSRRPSGRGRASATRSEQRRKDQKPSKAPKNPTKL